MTTSNWKVPLFDLDFDDAEERAVLKTLRSKWLTMGPKTEEFEKQFAQYLGHNTIALAVSSCTAALHMALISHRIGCDDEVIISGLSFVAALNVVTLIGATPIPADCKSLNDWNVSPAEIKRKITSRTKAVIIVHFAGYPCDMDQISKLCKDEKLVLIEDVAHAIGGLYRGQMCGTFGHTSCFSFFSNKNLSVGEGGMIVTSSKKHYNRFREIRCHGMNTMTLDRHRNKAISYDVTSPGLNYRFDEMRSALGLVQLKKLDSNNEKRKNIVQKYQQNLSEFKELTIPWFPISEKINSSYHIFPILFPSNELRNSFMNFAKTVGVQTSIHYPAYNDFSFYKESFGEKLRLAEEISRRGITLPLFPSMSEPQIQLVIQSIKDFINNSVRCR